MRLHRFFIPEKIGEAKEITISDPDLTHQWKNVFRFATGTRMLLFDDSGFEFVALVARLGFNQARLKILQKEDRRNILGTELCLFAALIKKNNFEWIIEKCTELGVSQIVPVISDRSEKKGLNMSRALKIIKEASEQSGRVKLTKLNEPTSLEELLKSIDMGDEERIKIFSIDPKGEPFPDKRSFRKEVAVFIGPEGGWSPRELQLFKLKKIPIYSIGRQVLRAETAAMAISSIFLLP